MALGAGASATGTTSIAIGTGATATGSIAAGTNAFASNGGAAFGDNSSASGTNSTAVGPGAIAAHANAAAFGNGATTTRANQQVFGTASNTYTLTGVASQASKDAQTGDTYLVTTDTNGNLATTTFSPSALQYDISALQEDVNSLQNRDKELASGIAIAMSMAQPIFQPGQTIAMRAGWGNFDGTSAASVTAAGVVAKGFLGPTSSLVVDGGVGAGTSVRMVAGRAGLSMGW